MSAVVRYPVSCSFVAYTGIPKWSLNVYIARKISECVFSHYHLETGYSGNEILIKDELSLYLLYMFMKISETQKSQQLG